MDTGKDVSDFKRFIELNREKLYTNSVKASIIILNAEIGNVENSILINKIEFDRALSELTKISQAMRDREKELYELIVKNLDKKQNCIEKSKRRDPGIVLGRLKNDGKVSYVNWQLTTAFTHQYKVKFSQKILQ